MEITVIALSVLLGIAIIGMGAIVIVQLLITSKDKRELERLLKARSLQEFMSYVPEEEEEIEEPDNLINIEQIGEYLGEKGEK